MKHNWQPAPLDTSGIQLPKELEELMERLAENVHDVWAQERIQNGWTYGPERSDALKQTPVLVPYAELSEAEKRYDRNTAGETLRSILMLGFEIRKISD